MFTSILAAEVYAVRNMGQVESMKNELTVIKSVEDRATEIMARIKVFERNGEFWTGSLSVAEAFGKRHDNIIEVIRKIDKENQLVNLLTFKDINYCDSRGREQTCYEMTETGFFSLVARFNRANYESIGIDTDGITFSYPISEYIDSFNRTQKMNDINEQRSRTMEQRMREGDRLQEIERERAKARQVRTDENRNLVVENFPPQDTCKSRDIAAKKLGM